MDLTPKALDINACYCECTSSYIFFAAQITTLTVLTYVGQGFNVKMVVLRSSRDREAIE